MIASSNAFANDCPKRSAACAITLKFTSSTTSRVNLTISAYLKAFNSTLRNSLSTVAIDCPSFTKRALDAGATSNTKRCVPAVRMMLACANTLELKSIARKIADSIVNGMLIAPLLSSEKLEAPVANPAPATYPSPAARTSVFANSLFGTDNPSMNSERISSYVFVILSSPLSFSSLITIVEVRISSSIVSISVSNSLICSITERNSVSSSSVRERVSSIAVESIVFCLETKSLRFSFKPFSLFIDFLLL